MVKTVTLPVRTDRDTGEALTTREVPAGASGYGFAPEPATNALIFGAYKPLLPCITGEVEHAKDEACDCEIYTVVCHKGKVYEVPLPDLVAEVTEDSDRVYVNDNLSSYVTDTRYANVSEAKEDRGFQYKDQVWVDGVPFGVIEFESNLSVMLKETIPSIDFRHNKETHNPGAYCKVCDWKLVYRKFLDEYYSLVLAIGFAPSGNEVERALMEWFTAEVVAHHAEHHSNLTAQDFCDHGQRRFVQSRSKSTGQPFKALFCPARNKTEACEPVWLND